MARPHTTDAVNSAHAIRPAERAKYHGSCWLMQAMVGPPPLPSLRRGLEFAQTLAFFSHDSRSGRPRCEKNGQSRGRRRLYPTPRTVWISGGSTSSILWRRYEMYVSSTLALPANV